MLDKIDDEDIYFTYRIIKKVFPYKTISLAKNLCNTKEIAFIADRKNVQQFFDKKEIEILKASHFKALKMTKEYNDVINYLAGLQVKFNLKHNASIDMLNKNLRNLEIQKISFLNSLKYLASYDSLYNVIETRKMEKSEIKNSENFFTLAHELGHLNFTELKLENGCISKYSGLNKTKYGISDFYLLDDNKSYLVRVEEYQDDDYYGIDDLLNDEQAYRMLNDNNLFDDDNMLKYENFGALIEYIAGEDTCVKAREKHDINLIKEKLLSINSSKYLFDKLINSLDILFSDKCTEEDKIQCYKFLLYYVGALSIKQIKNGCFNLEKFADATTLDIGNKNVEKAVSDMVLKLNNYVHENIEKNQEKPCNKNIQIIKN